MQGQTPRSDPNLNLIAAWDRENIYYIDESRPSIIEAKANRAGGEVQIKAKVYSLTGINEVFALAESTHSALTSTLGRATVSTPKLLLAPDKNDPSFNPNCPYGGPYIGTVPDPCPNETNYRIALYAIDNSSRPKISTYMIPIGTSIENETMAVILYSDPSLLPQGEGERLQNQIARAESILRGKGLEYDIKKVSSLSALFEIYPLPEGRTFFLYMIGNIGFEEKGEEKIPHFYLNPYESLTPVDLLAALPQDPNQRFLVLLDAPYASDFLSSALNNNAWPERGAGIASTNRERLFFPLGQNGPPHQERLFPCFSNFFFSAILSGGTVAQSYRMAERAVSLTLQGPELFLPGKIENYQTMNRHLNYYIGRSGIAGEDYSLFTMCNAKAEKAGETLHYHLSITPHPEAKIDRAWAILIASSDIYQKSIPVDLDTNNRACLESGDNYYQAYFMVEGKHREDSDISLTEWQQVAIAHIGDEIKDDGYEPDPSSDSELRAILGNPDHRLIVNDLPIRRAFYDEDCVPGAMCTDIDWMYFKAQKDHIYEIYAQDLSEQGYFIRIALYDPNIQPVPQDPNKPDGPFFVDRNLLIFPCSKTGYYLLETRLASSYPPGGAAYILSVTDPQCKVYTPATIEVIDPCAERLFKLSVRINADGKYITPGIEEFVNPNTYRFSFHDSEPHTEVTVEVYDKNKLSNNAIDEAAIIKTEAVTFKESTANEKTIDLTPIACVIDPIPLSYSDWVESWQELIWMANPLPEGDSDPNLLPVGYRDPNLLPVGDYDGDEMINFMEYHLATSPINPTVSLHLRQGENLYYFPAICEGDPITIPNNMLLRPYYAYDQSRGAWYYSDPNRHSQRVCYYHDPDKNIWQEEKNCPNFVNAFAKHTFNALNAATAGALYLDLDDPQSPILSLRGFSCPWSFDDGPNPEHKNEIELFNPYEFKEGVKIREVLTNIGQIEAISCPNKRTGRIDSTYRFFGKSAGDNSDVSPDEMYIIHKKGRVP